MPEGTDIETSIDRLLNYVRAKGRVDLYSAAQAMGLPAAQVEKVAGMLEQSGLLEVRYSLTGIHLIAKREVPAPPPKEEAEKHEATLREEEARLEREVRDSERIVEFVEEDLMKRLHAAEQALRAIERSGHFSEEDLRRLRREIDTLRIEVDAVRQRTRMLEHEEEEFLQRLSQFAQKLDQLKAREVMLSVHYKRRGRLTRWFAELVEGFKGLFRPPRGREPGEVAA